MFTLTAKIRGVKEKLATLRKSGFIPAVYYGGKEKSTAIAIDIPSFKKVWKGAGESSIITLKTDHGDIDSLLYEVQVDPVTGEPIHADFYTVDKDTEIHADVHFEFIGVSPAIKDLGGVLVKVLHEIEVKSLPRNLPHNIQVDISKLTELESHITVADIVFPKGVTTTEKSTEIIVLVSTPREEIIDEPVVPVDLSAIEVEKKGKKEEEGILVEEISQDKSQDKEEKGEKRSKEKRK